MLKGEGETTEWCVSASPCTVYSYTEGWVYRVGLISRLSRFLNHFSVWVWRRQLLFFKNCLWVCVVADGWGSLTWPEWDWLDSAWVRPWQGNDAVNQPVGPAPLPVHAPLTLASYRLLFHDSTQEGRITSLQFLTVASTRFAELESLCQNSTHKPDGN